MTQGHIHLIIGPMYASKSSELIKIANKYKVIKTNILAINHSINDRYGTTNISTHDKLILDNCISTNDLNSLIDTELYTSAKVIIIEELQFFNNALDFIVNAADNDKKTIIAAGLAGDFNKQPFGDVLSLIPHADKITKLSALCKFCNDGTKANFTKRIKNSQTQIKVGSEDTYEAVCRKHYLE